MVVEAGFTETVVPLRLPGIQLYVEAPDAVREDEDPLQIVAGEAEADTVGFGFTVMVRMLEVAGLPVAQVAVEAMTQLTVLPVASVVDV